MTIAAGFEFKNGILICADRQFSGASVKLFDSKLSHLNSSGDKPEHDMRAIIAMSGTDGYMQTAVRKCEDALIDISCDSDADITSPIIRDALEGALIEVHEKHFFKHPDWGYTTGPYVELIIGVRAGSEQPILFWTHETAVNEVARFKCVGSGGSIASYAMSPLYPSTGIDLKQLLLIAAHGLRVAKQYDPYCGGESEFAAMFDEGGESHIHPFTITTGESYSDTFQEILRELFFASADLTNEQAYIDAVVEHLRTRVLQIRREQRAELKKRDVLMASLLLGNRGRE